MSGEGEISESAMGGAGEEGDQEDSAGNVGEQDDPAGDKSDDELEPRSKRTRSLVHEHCLKKNGKFHCKYCT